MGMTVATSVVRIRAGCYDRKRSAGTAFQDEAGQGGDVHFPILYSKIHRATVTAADLHYEGSITIDRRLMDLADLVPHQQVQIYNISNGARFETYVMEGATDSGCIQINGAAAHRAKIGDLIIVAAYAAMSRQEAATWEPKIVLVDRHNRPGAARPLPVSSEIDEC
jgi:aspartate 1-decarboxylase